MRFIARGFFIMTRIRKISFLRVGKHRELFGSISMFRRRIQRLRWRIVWCSSTMKKSSCGREALENYWHVERMIYYLFHVFWRQTDCM